MTILTASDINKTSYYKVTQEDELSVTFYTNLGIRYNVGLTKDHFIFQDNSYFLHTVSNKHPAGHDINVYNTIIAILENAFLNSKETLMLYICDPSDSKQAARSRLFEQWFHKYPHNNEYHLEVYHSLDNGVDYYYGLIIRKDTPNLDDIINSFKDFLTDY